MRGKLLALLLCAFCGTTTYAYADAYPIYGVQDPQPALTVVEPMSPGLPVAPPEGAEQAYDDGLEIFTYKEEIDGDPEQQPSYLEELLSDEEIDSAGADSNCRPGRVYGCRDNGCAGLYPTEKSCTAVQRLATGTDCPYTFKASASFCDSDHDCRCNVNKSVAIANYYLVLGCPRAGMQTVSCTPV